MTKTKKQQPTETATHPVSFADPAGSNLLEAELDDLEGTPLAEIPTEGRSRRFKEVWLVEDRKNARSVWTRVGTAFENADGSWNIKLSAVPLGGRLNVRDPLPRERAVEA